MCGRDSELWSWRRGRASAGPPVVRSHKSQRWTRTQRERTAGDTLETAIIITIKHAKYVFFNLILTGCVALRTSAEDSMQ